MQDIIDTDKEVDYEEAKKIAIDFYNNTDFQYEDYAVIGFIDLKETGNFIEISQTGYIRISLKNKWNEIWQEKNIDKQLIINALQAFYAMVQQNHETKKD